MNTNQACRRDAGASGRPDAPARSGCKWTTEEVDDLRRLARERLKAAAIAYRLQRSVESVRGKAANCGIDLVSERSPATVTLLRFRSEPLECRNS